eukprot:13732862-Heterocapsa_arctica.AAC.1
MVGMRDADSFVWRCSSGGTEVVQTNASCTGTLDDGLPLWGVHTACSCAHGQVIPWARSDRAQHT